MKRAILVLILLCWSSPCPAAQAPKIDFSPELEELHQAEKQLSEFNMRVIDLFVKYDRDSFEDFTILEMLESDIDAVLAEQDKVVGLFTLYQMASFGPEGYAEVLAYLDAALGGYAIHIKAYREMLDTAVKARKGDVVNGLARELYAHYDALMKIITTMRAKLAGC